MLKDSSPLNKFNSYDDTVKKHVNGILIHPLWMYFIHNGCICNFVKNIESPSSLTKVLWCGQHESIYGNFKFYKMKKVGRKLGEFGNG
tara:strand:- start:222 stop:485 length:264 start_codon:yes stop_codon:yes gene_type:complete